MRSPLRFNRLNGLVQSDIINLCFALMVGLAVLSCESNVKALTNSSTWTDSLLTDLLEARLAAQFAASREVFMPTRLIRGDTVFIEGEPIFLAPETDSVEIEIPADQGNYVVVLQSDETWSWFIWYDKKNEPKGKYRTHTFRGLSFFYPQFDGLKTEYYNQFYKHNRINRRVVGEKYGLTPFQVDSTVEEAELKRARELLDKFQKLRVQYPSQRIIR